MSIFGPLVDDGVIRGECPVGHRVIYPKTTLGKLWAEAWAEAHEDCGTVRSRRTPPKGRRTA